MYKELTPWIKYKTRSSKSPLWLLDFLLSPYKLLLHISVKTTMTYGITPNII